VKINKDKQQKKVKSKRENKAFLAQSVPYLVLCILTIIFVAIVQYYLVVVQPAEGRNQTFVRVTMTSYIEQILARLDSIQLAAKTILNDSQIKKTLRDGKAGNITAIEKDITERLDNVIGVRIVDNDIHDVDMQSTPVITNVTLQLIRQLNANKEVVHEAINAGESTQHIAIIFQVAGTGKTILLGIDFALFNNVLPDNRLVPGYYEFMQNFANQNRAIVSLGKSVYKKGEPLGTASVSGTPWRVAFWPDDPAKYNYETELYLFFGGVALVLLLVGVGGFIGLNRMQKMVRSDATNFVKWLIDSRNRKSLVATTDFNLKVFDDMGQALERESFKITDTYGTVQTDQKVQRIKRSPDQPMLEHGSSALEVSEPAGASTYNSIFRAYDIRGIVDKELTESLVYKLGLAIGSEAFERGEQRIVVARDGRLSGTRFVNALKKGLMETGRDIIDIGVVPTPLMYFATHHLNTNSGIVITGSHNPKDYNGLKIIIAGHTLYGEEIQGLRQRIETNNMVKGKGSQKEVNIVQEYISRITDTVSLANPLKVAIDCGNGIAGKVAPQLLQALGCDVIGLYCNVDGNFPNHHPDPSRPENLEDLIKMVKSESADIGLAFDGDGDRLGVIDSNGNIIWPDRQMMLYAMDVLSRNAGTDIIFDVKCSKNLANVITESGGNPIMWKSGHSLIKAKMRETGALLAGEGSGHIYFKERWYGFDDALYAASRLLEILSADTRKSAAVFKSLPDSLSTPEINIPIADDKKFNFVERLKLQGAFGDGDVITIDGVRVEYQDGWGLVRASNTSPCLVARFEARNQSSLERIKKMFRQQLLMVDSSLNVDF